MKNIIYLLVCFLPLYSWAAKPSAQLEVQVIERVKEYCSLMSGFAGNSERIEDIDKIIAICENNKVSTYDDFSSAIEPSSKPLFDYLQNITLSYENKVQLTYSQFEFKEINTSPSYIPNMPPESYAQVIVSKNIKGNGINKVVRNIITVNIGTMKIGGTTDENYKDPYGIYLEGKKAIQNHEYVKAEKFLQKVSKIRTFSYRYRAMTELGAFYLCVLKNYEKAFKWLTNATEKDPLAEIYLAIFYMSGPIEKLDKTTAFRLLEKNANFRDKDYTTIQDLAKLALSGLYAGYIPNPNIQKNLNKAIEYSKAVTTSEDKSIAIIANTQVAQLLLYANEDNECLTYINKFSDNEVVINTSHEFFCNFISTKLLIYKQINKELYIQEIKYLENKFLHYGEICLIVGEYYLNDEKNYITAYKTFQKGIELRNGTCAFKISCMYENGLGVTKSIKECVNWLEKAAEFGSSDALYCLGSFYQWGNTYYNIPSDIQKSVAYFKEAATKGSDVKSALMVADTYLWGTNNFTVNPTEAMKWYKVAADMGNSEACLYIGYLYQGGKGVDKDLNEAMRWYKTCVDYGDCEIGTFGDADNFGLASIYIGNFYDEFEKDIDYPKNMTEAFKWYSESAKKRKEAYYYLGRFHESGIIVNKDLKEAYRLYSLATEKTRKACMKVGEFHEKGEIIPKDLNKALQWYIQALTPNPSINEPMDDIKKDIHSRIVHLVIKSKINNLIGELIVTADNDIEAGKRIELADAIIQKYFSSENAKIQLLGSNNSTIVATETVRSYLDKICTGKTIECFVIQTDSLQKDAQGKIISLVIQEIRDTSN